MKIYQKNQIKHFFKISGIAVILSLILSLGVHLFVEYHLKVEKILLTATKIFFDVLPLVFIKQKNFLFKDGPGKATLLILYYLLLVPFINFSLDLDENNKNIQYIFQFLSFFNVLLLIISHIILLKYVVIDFFKRRRKIVARDIGIVITTYMTIAISFGLIYTLLSLFSKEPVFNGVNQAVPTFHFYLQHIYFSFITIATVGYGDIYPITPIGHFLVVMEIMMGIILTNVILGLVIGSGILTTNKKEK